MKADVIHIIQIIFKSSSVQSSFQLYIKKRKKELGKEQEKTKVSRKKKTIKIRVEMKEIETRKKIEGLIKLKAGVTKR